MSRRGFLGGALALGAVAVLHNRSHESPSFDEANKTETNHLRQVSTHEELRGPREYDMGDLTGCKFSAELSDYTGIDGDVPEKARIDFSDLLRKMWSKKLAQMNKVGGDAIPIVEFRDQILASYNPESVTKSNLHDYEHTIQLAIDQVHIPRVELIRMVPAFAHLTDTQLSLLKRLESLINARALLTYSVTEIMPTEGADSAIGVELYDFLLQNAGSELFGCIPALHDKYLSFGPYQFTRYAIGDEKQVHNGASVMNHYIWKDKKLPKYVGEMQGNDHHKAAYLLALYNIAHLVKELGPATPKALDHDGIISADMVLQYIATAHHKPNDAINAFTEYADAYTRPKQKHTSEHAVPVSFADFCKTNRIGDYCEKTKSNSVALKQFLGSEKHTS